MAMFCPVIQEARRERRKTISSATSSGSPMRPIGMTRSRSALPETSIPSVMFDRTTPGDTVLSRMVGAYSSAAAAVSATTPAFAAAYGPSPVTAGFR